MRSVSAAVACLLAALVLAAVGHAETRLGVNDDAGKFDNGAPAFFEAMQSLGLTENVMTILWDPERPTEIKDMPYLKNALPVAALHGVDIVFDVYPAKARALSSDVLGPAKFAAFVKKLAQTFPSVKQYIVMNECNQPRFIQPQFAGRTNVSAALCGVSLALSYDALKSIDPGITVWGIGLSPRGNDNPNAPNNISTSPVRFLAALGSWYRASGRTLPLMDGLAFHPYPNSNKDAFGLGYPWPKIGAVNLDRLYQAFWDAFHDTRQPTFAEWAPGGDSTMRLSVNEVGVQVDTRGKPGYVGKENIPAVDPMTQARWYAQLISSTVCDPHVASLNLFHLIDEPNRRGFQSGLFGLGYSRRPAADVVQRASRTCAGSLRRWRHAEHVIGAKADFHLGSEWSVRVTATEDAEYTVGVLAVEPAGASPGEIEQALTSEFSPLEQVHVSSGFLGAYRRPATRGTLPSGCYQLAAVFRAALNPERTTTIASPVLDVGGGCALSTP
jgi:hypothetical protein